MKWQQKLGNSKHLKHNKLDQRKAAGKDDICIKNISHTNFIYLNKENIVKFISSHCVLINKTSYFSYVQILQKPCKLTEDLDKFDNYIFSYLWSSCLLYFTILEKVIGYHRHDYPPSICIKRDLSLAAWGSKLKKKRAIHLYCPSPPQFFLTPA